MSDNNTPGGGSGSSVPPNPPQAQSPQPTPMGPPRPPFPWTRFFFSVGFALLAWVVFWAVVLMAALQFVTLAISSELNHELKNISHNLVKYLGELLSYIVYAREERPFQIGRAHV